MLKLTRHFIDNWRDRVGNDPTPGAVMAVIKESIHQQAGRRFGSDSVLTWYIHFGLKIALSVDHFNGTAVSVLSEVNMPGNKTKAQKRYFRQSGYVAMTMHRR